MDLSSNKKLLTSKFKQYPFLKESHQELKAVFTENPLIETRIQATLPMGDVELLRRLVMDATDLKLDTYWKNISGRVKTQNMKIIFALSAFLGCTVKEVLDPSYEFVPFAKREAQAAEKAIMDKYGFMDPDQAAEAA